MNIADASSRVQQSLSLGATTVTFSVYLYSAVSFTLRIVAAFDSSTVARNITIPAGQWTRFAETFTSITSFTQIQIRGLSGGSTGDIYLWGAQLETSDFGATDYIPTTTAAVSVGITADIPRLDYTGGGCPSLLLEPQRTNLVQFSEQFNNAYHTKNQASVTANTSASPDGYTNADKLIPNTTSTDDHRLSGGTLTVVSGSAYTTSVFVKNGGYNVVSVRSAAGKTVQVNLTTGAAIAYGSPTATSVVDYGNGWYRVSITDNASSTSYAPAILVQNTTASQYPIWVGNNTDGILIYGFQVELGSYPTSYIPTLGASVTRLADAASKTGISSLIGQTEGTIYAEFTAFGGFTAVRNVINLNSGGSANFVAAFYLNNIFYARLRINNSTSFDVTKSGLTEGTHKVAIAYAANDLTMYIDGVIVGQNTAASVSFSSPLDEVSIGENTIGAEQLGGTISQALVFKTRLTNAQLAQLTAL
jgi:hypothetical protein